MDLTFMLFVSSFFLVIFSCIGFGLFFNRFLNFNKNILCTGYYGLIGIFFLIIYSYVSHYFYPHTYTHNLILLILGLIFFFYFFKFNFSSNLLITIIVFSIILVGFIIFKTHDDFPYYHFPYTYYLTQNPIILGIGRLNHVF